MIIIMEDEYMTTILWPTKL